MERKDFIKKVAVGCSLLLIAPTFFESCSSGNDLLVNDPGISSPITIDLTSSEFSSLNTVGGFAYKDNIIIIHTGSNQYTALSKICTHQGCTLTYNKSTNQLPCPCHGSVFNLSGGVIIGPASTSIKKYNVQVNGDTLVIS